AREVHYTQNEACSAIWATAKRALSFGRPSHRMCGVGIWKAVTCPRIAVVAAPHQSREGEESSGGGGSSSSSSSNDSNNNNNNRTSEFRQAQRAGKAAEFV